jgi:hypothetical protein
MSDKQQEFIRDLTERISSYTYDWSVYWKMYSSLSTWRYWVNVIIFVLPLIVLVFKLDKSKAYRIGFYGFVIHVTATYIDLYGITHKMWEYPYQIFTFPPVNFGLDASLIPVSYMLVYQWTLNRNKNYYLYTTILGVVIAFVLKPLTVYLDLFHVVDSNYFQVFLHYFFAGLAGKWLTDFFNLAQERSKLA